MNWIAIPLIFLPDVRIKKTAARRNNLINKHTLDYEKN